MSSDAYTTEQTATLITLLKAGFDHEVLARTLNRSVTSIRVKASKLRAARLLDAAPGRAPPPCNNKTAAVPGIYLSEDAALVRNCLDEGGFPTAVALDGRTFWIRPDGSQWAHTPPARRRKAA